MTGPRLATGIVTLDRAAAAPLGEQLLLGLRQAILEGVLRPGDRLPSSRDLAVQLGVARGTVRTAYERLEAEDLIVGAGPAGSLVNGGPPPRTAPAIPIKRAWMPFQRPSADAPLPFQPGVPAQDAFPAKLWARMRVAAARTDALAAPIYADVQGEPDLRAAIAAHLAIARGMSCRPEQVFVTGGYRQGLALVLAALQAHGRSAWLEEPGYPIARLALAMAGIAAVPVPVDGDGLRVDEGVRSAPEAALALVTPGQQAPLGGPLAPARRDALLAWAEGAGAWVLEDDYLGELQLGGRAAPALAAGRGADRVIHLGTFSKTLSPALGLGIVVAPPVLVDPLLEAATVLVPAPNRATQLPLATFLADGHYLRHLRKMKALYARRMKLAGLHLAALGLDVRPAGLSLLASLPDDVDDVALAARALAAAIGPVPLSPWYARREAARRGLLLSVTNITNANAEAACAALARVLADG